MSVTESALVTVDVPKCEDLAALIRSKSIPVDGEDLTLAGFTPRQTGNLFLFLVAICHQTSPRGAQPLAGTVGGVLRRGWDYLSAKFEADARVDSRVLTPMRWSEMSDDEFSELFRDPSLGLTLSDVPGRVALVRDLGVTMKRRGWTWLDDLYAACDGRAATGDPNLFELLAQFRAYSDPVRKKSSFLLSLMRNSGFWRYVDDEKVGPPVDYHEVRGHLRIGTVSVNDADLRQKLLSRLPVSESEDVAIRQAVYDAIMLVSELTGLRNPSQHHYLFWNVFRCCCNRESPHCQKCPSGCALPERYVPLAVCETGTRRCPFSRVCSSADVQAKFEEHVFETDFY